MRRVPRPRFLAVGAPCLTLALTLCVPQAPALAGGEPARDGAEVCRVFPAGRASQDARHSRRARTTDTRVDWEPPFDPIAWLERVKELKTHVQLAGGIWPYPGATLVDEVRAVHDRGEYTVENVLFHSYFYQFIPGNLYRSKVGPEKKPVILLPHGHEDGRLMERSDEEARRLVERGEERTFEAAKYPLQARATQLARMGCNVLVYDLPGFGELTDWDHEQGFGSVEDVLRLQNLYAFQLWNSFMALNYIWNQEGVDEEKVGMAGAGAGGSQALFFSAIDRRVKATFVANTLSDRYQGGCRCENPSFLRLGTSNVEIAAAIAPRALAFTSVGDWSCDLEHDVLPKLREVWDMAGSADDVVAGSWPEHEHAFNAHGREMLYDFFDEKLDLGFDGPIVEQPFEPLSPDELRVFTPAQPDKPVSAKSATEVFELLTEHIDEQLRLLFYKEDPHRVFVFRGVHLPALRTMLDTEYPEPGQVLSKVVGTERRGASTVLKLALGREDAGEEVPAVLVMPDEWNGVVLVGVAHDGKQHFFGGGDSSFAGALRVVEQGAAFLSPDVLLTGESLNGRAEEGLPSVAVDEDRHGRYVGYTYCYNRTLIAERVHDILTTIAFARSLDGVKAVNLAGTGDAGPWVLMARGLIGTRETVGDDVFRTAAQWSWDFDHVRSFADPNFLPGALRYGGVPYFTALIAPAYLRLTGSPRDTFPPEIPEVVAKAYRSLDEIDNVRTGSNAQHEHMIDWLAGGPGE